MYLSISLSVYLYSKLYVDWARKFSINQSFRRSFLRLRSVSLFISFLPSPLISYNAWIWIPYLLKDNCMHIYIYIHIAIVFYNNIKRKSAKYS